MADDRSRIDDRIENRDTPDQVASGGGTQGRQGEVREPRPENAAQDPQAAARQAQVERDSDAMRDSARRVEASTPSEARDRTVQDMTRDIEREADQSSDRR